MGMRRTFVSSEGIVVGEQDEFGSSRASLKYFHFICFNYDYVEFPSPFL